MGFHLSVCTEGICNTLMWDQNLNIHGVRSDQRTV